MAKREDFKTVQIRSEDKDELESVYKKSGKFRWVLLHEAIELLKKKYRMEEEG